MGNYILEMTGIVKEFPGVKALDNAQLFLRPGTVHALMGENGAGKSTLMKCLFGIYKKDAGSIKVRGGIRRPKTSLGPWCFHGAPGAEPGTANTGGG